MSNKKIVIVGGVAAGTKAAAKIRREIMNYIGARGDTRQTR